MEQSAKPTSNKGGRPVKEVKKNRVVTMKCTSYEKMMITAKAQAANLSVSEYLLHMAMSGRIDRREKTLPRKCWI